VKEHAIEIQQPPPAARADGHHDLFRSKVVVGFVWDTGHLFELRARSPLPRVFLNGKISAYKYPIDLVCQGILAG
jgi:hypothetical protein